MSRLMSERLRTDLAEELGVAQTVRREGWGGVPSRDCGNLVRRALIRAQRQLAASERPAPPPRGT